MPCKDISENLVLELDFSDRLVAYSYSKATCDKAIGKKNLLINYLKSKLVVDIMDLDSTEFLKRIQFESMDDEYLHLKHLRAVQESLKIILGKTINKKSVQKIISNSKSIKFTLTLNLKTPEKIDACTSSCSGCASK